MRINTIISSTILLICLILPEMLFAQPAERFKVKDVFFTGNEVYSDRQLLRRMISRPSSIFRKIYFFPEVFNDDLRSIELFYRQNGYLESQLSSGAMIFDSLRHEVRIEIMVSEGPLTLIDGVGILDNHEFTDATLLRLVNISPGEPLRSTKVEQATLAIMTHYANNGFLDAVVTPDIRTNTETNTSLIDFIIQENTRYSIDSIHITGLEKTKQHVVQRELLFKTAEIVSFSKILESQKQLYLTGLFQSVFIRPVQPQNENSTKKEIIVDVKENLSIETGASFGYGTIEKLKGQFELINSNVFGSARKIAFTTKISSILYNFDIAYTEPWIFNIPMNLDVNIFKEKREEPAYDVNRQGLNMVTGKDLTDHKKVTTAYKLERALLSNIRTSEIPGEATFDISSLKLSFIHDSRSNLFNPVQGSYVEISNELGISFRASTREFYRAEGRVKNFVSLTPSMVLASALEIGYMDTKGGLLQIPLHERFYAGGPNTIRGLAYRSAGKIDASNQPVGGTFKLVINLVELRYFYKILGGVLFLDAGNVWESRSQIDINDIHKTAGAGLRVNTPIGLMRLDYGFNLNKRPNDKSGIVYFSIGHAF
ncbi:outer membrane protein assembly factor BamA [candidate division KSB1 bacterium]